MNATPIHRGMNFGFWARAGYYASPAASRTYKHRIPNGSLGSRLRSLDGSVDVHVDEGQWGRWGAEPEA